MIVLMGLLQKVLMKCSVSDMHILLVGLQGRQFALLVFIINETNIIRFFKAMNNIV